MSSIWDEFLASLDPVTRGFFIQLSHVFLNPDDLVPEDHPAKTKSRRPKRERDPQFVKVPPVKMRTPRTLENCAQFLSALGLGCSINAQEKQDVIEEVEAIVLIAKSGGVARSYVVKFEDTWRNPWKDASGTKR